MQSAPLTVSRRANHFPAGASSLPPAKARAVDLDPHREGDRVRSVAQTGFDYAVRNPRVAGQNRMQLGKDAEIRATRWLRKWAERNKVGLGQGGLRFQVRGSNSVPDVLYDPGADETPRSALARDVWDLRRIYREDGLYGSKVRSALRRYIDSSRRTFYPAFER